MNTITIAAAQYDIGFFEHWNSYSDKLHTWVSQAAAQCAELLLFPEYGSMELASLFGSDVYSDLNKQLHALQSIYADVQSLHLELAKQYNLLIAGASFPVLLPENRFHNRATIYAPEGILGFQDKLIMTRFEREQWHISGGQSAVTINTDFGPIGINICYDSEFPLLARKQVEAGAKLILAPSCTDTAAGFNRVRIGCQARALENQCYVVQSPTIGEAPWSEAVDINTGRASIYTPVDRGFPDNGLLAEGEMDKPKWVVATLDLEKIDQVRKEGQVLNHRDWAEQQQCL